MSLTQFISRLDQIEKAVESIFQNQFSGMDNDSITFVVGPLNQTDWHNVDAWLKISRSDLSNEVLQSLLHLFSDNYATSLGDSSLVSVIASRLQAASEDLRNAHDLWDQLLEARQEVFLAPGGLNKEEFWRYREYSEKGKNSLMRHLVSTAVNLREIDDAVSGAKASDEIRRIPGIRCPINGERCTKELVDKPQQIFVGFQTQSDHYKTPSLKLMITEALQTFDLVPFFAIDHYEPVHISCEICHAIQEASVCIFEISDSNPNVMFELGVAYMVGKATVLLARKGSPGTHISDIAGIHRVEYDDLVECRDFIRRCLADSATIRNLLTKSGKG